MTNETTTVTETENSETTPAVPATETTTTETPSSSTTEQTPLTLAPDDKPADDQSTDDKPTDDKQDERTDEQKAADAERETLFGAPAEGETYKLEGLPEGTVIDEEALKAIEPQLRKLGLSNKGASELIAGYAETVLPRVATQITDQLQNQVLETRKTWETEARQAIAGKNEKGEPVVLKSGTGVDLTFDGLAEPKVMQTAARALDRIAPAGFREFLKETGIDRHPGMVALCYNAGKLLAEDTDAGGAGGGSGGKPKSQAEKFYG